MPFSPPSQDAASRMSDAQSASPVSSRFSRSCSATCTKLSIRAASTARAPWIMSRRATPMVSSSTAAKGVMTTTSVVKSMDETA